MGLAQTLATLSELPVLLFSNRLLKRLKPHGMLMMGMGFTVLRLLLYAAISTPQGVLVSQLMNGLTFAVVWVAGVSYVDQSAPPGMSATAQGLFGGDGLRGRRRRSAASPAACCWRRWAGAGCSLVAGLFLLVSLAALILLERRGAPDQRLRRPKTVKFP